ncbi:MAG: glycosyltransferase [Bacteroidota bacterium]
MKVLQLCLKVPFPPNDGGCIAMHNMQKSWWANNIQVKVLTFNTIKHPVQLDQLPTEYLAKTNIEGVYLDNRVKIFDALKALIAGESYNVKRFISADFSEKLKSILKSEQFDVIQLESLYMAPYIEDIRQCSTAKIVFRPHNIEYKIWERLAKNTLNPIKKFYLKVLTKQLKKYEESILNKIDYLLPLTWEDAQELTMMRCRKSMMVLPIGVHANEYKVIPPPNNQVVFHLGAMDWLPNAEGVKWFLTEVWPLVSAKNKQVQLRLAGKGMPASIMKLNASNVIVTNWVEDVQSFFKEGQVMIVPLLSGSGMRVKIIEGMAMGKAIVTTRIGLEGIVANDQEHLRIADSPADFAGAILDLLDDESAVEKLGKAARQLVEVRYELNFLGKKWAEFLKNN